MKSVQQIGLTDEVKKQIDSIFNSQNGNLIELATRPVKVRKQKLRLLKNNILDNKKKIREALYNDFGKHASEVDMTEIYPVVSEIKHAISHLKYWTSGHKVKTPLALLGSSSKILFEPKGNSLIMAPWNFPFNLSLAPLVSAVAAGNAVIIKPSEFTPHASHVIREIVEMTFDRNEVAVVEGAVDVSKYILTKKFNHIFFTGSPKVGKEIMKAASAHLASVTLELGGKSPTVVDSSADIEKAAKRIAWGKFVNNGQICIAPDYILVDSSKESELIDALKRNLKNFYGSNPKDEPSYARIVNDQHYSRLTDTIEDAVNKGGRVESGGQHEEQDNFIAPTIISNPALDSRIMQEEIFGPLLPIVTFDSLDEAIELINSKEKPLAMYIYSRNKKNIRHLINNTSAGASCINHNAVHFYNTNLPFGGVNNSGIGKSHGFAGFQEFSNARAIFKQNIPNALELLVPPYNDFKQKLIDITLKYF